MTLPIRPGAVVPPKDPRRGGLLFVLASNMLIDALEVSVMVVAMPVMKDDLRLSLPEVQWAMSGFALGFGGLMLLGGRLVELLGRRRVYLTALLVFAAVSLAGALVEDPALLLATRFVKGFAAALTAPTGLAILSTVIPQGRARARALSVYAFFGACGFTVGLVLSGLLTEVSWRWTMAFPAPVVLLLFVAGRRLIPADHAPRGAARLRVRDLDLPGACALTGGLLALAYGLVSLPAGGLQDPRVIGAFVVGLGLLAAIPRIERAATRPLLRPDRPAGRVLLRSALGAGALNGSYLGLLFILTFQLRAAGWGPLETGLALLPASAPLAATALFSGRLASRFGTARLVAVGSALPFIGYVLYLRRPVPDPYVGGVLPTLLLVAAGFVLAFAALNMQAAASVPPAVRAQASGLYQSAVQIGAVVVLAVVTALLADGQGAGGPPRAAMAFVAGVGLLGFLAGLRGVLPRPPRAGRVAGEGG
ncbi:MFS transporter [Streptomyces cyaneofuscatus]|uniref:MFS transporter n=1 Tax=Streptomyces cyaneofuscatus TaxID=66883 RepID=UPI003648C5F3